ncbi:BrnT family toxin [Paraburkholderia humisilvae]|nr:BrnT family toxin [Paraburkholderia humisilvae]
MEVEFDPAKDAANQKKHGIPLSLAESFEWDAAQVKVDDRFDYPETRMVAIGPIGDRIHVIVYAMRGEALRVISLRKANRREVLKYVDQA